MPSLGLVSDVNAQGGDIVGMRNGNGTGISRTWIMIQGFAIPRFQTVLVVVKWYIASGISLSGRDIE